MAPPPPPIPSLRDAKEFTLLLPAGLVTFSFPSDSAEHRRISIPKGSTWSPGPHWHEHYTEYTRVVKGRVKFVIGGEVSVLGPEDGVVTFPKYVVHDFCRADRDSKSVEGPDEEGEVIVEEWTDPEDGFKLIFFRNVMSAFADPSLSPNNGHATATSQAKITIPLLLQLLTTISYVDNFLDPLPFLPNHGLLGSVSFGMKWCLTHGLYSFGSFVGWCAGYEQWRKEYTPKELWVVAERGAYPYKQGKVADIGAKSD